MSFRERQDSACDRLSEIFHVLTRLAIMTELSASEKHRDQFILSCGFEVSRVAWLLEMCAVSTVQSPLRRTRPVQDFALWLFAIVRRP